jgi:molybdopterin-containing oxidoreductase family iron-sulfur binding subunit
MKCDFCPDETRAGELPFCVRGCPQGALWFGDLEEDMVTNGKEVKVLSRFLADHDAFRLKEHLGTEPRVHYISGHGERLGRSPYRRGRLATLWPWKALKGATAWKR